MKIGYSITDFKISSVRIYRFTLYAFLALIVVFIAAELSIGLRSTAVELLLPSGIGITLMILLSYRFPGSSALKTGSIVLIYIIMEAHFINNPTIYHAIIFWFPFVPLIALIIMGTRASLLWIGILLVTFVLDSMYTQTLVGDSYPVDIRSDQYLFTAFIFTIAISTNSFILYHLLGKAYLTAEQKKAELESIKEETESRRTILEEYMRAFIEFSKDESNFNQGQLHLFRSICKTTAQTLDVNRVSVWLFDKTNTKLIRHYLYDETNESDEILELERSHFPNYFEALSNEPYIMASDARNDVHTREFTESYLTPLNIYSMLDCPITIDRTPIGVICCEQQQAIKHWKTEDTLFIQSFVDFIAMSYKNQRIEGLVQELRQTNQELISKNKEIELMNAALDTTVQRRTDDLKNKNARLTEYSFINSHLLRAPLSRILGLSQAISKEVTSTKERELIEALIQSSDELDSIIRKINEVLYSGNGLTREDLERIEEKVEAERQ